MQRLSGRFSKRFKWAGFEKGDPKKNFDLVELLGEGTYGSVWVADDRKAGRQCALKIVPVDQDEEEIQQEIDIMRESDSPYIVKLFSAWESADHLKVWISMEICDAGSVNDLMFVTDETLTEQQIREVATSAAQGLAYLHESNIIHRDIKAGNILLNSGGQIKLADFGVSAKLQSKYERSHTAIGAPYWMSPEVISEEGYDGRADVWSLGITCIEMAEARPPNAHIHPMRALFLIPTQKPPKLQEPEQWSKDFVSFVNTCLVKTHDKRSTAKEILAHKFVAKTVKKLAAHAGCSTVIAKLVTAALPEIEAFRSLEESDEEMSDDGTFTDASLADLEADLAKSKQSASPDAGFAASPKSNNMAKAQTFFELEADQEDTPEATQKSLEKEAKLGSLFAPRESNNQAKKNKKKNKEQAKEPPAMAPAPPPSAPKSTPPTAPPAPVSVAHSKAHDHELEKKLALLRPKTLKKKNRQTLKLDVTAAGGSAAAATGVTAAVKRVSSRLTPNRMSTKAPKGRLSVKDHPVLTKNDQNNLDFEGVKQLLTTASGTTHEQDGAQEDGGQNPETHLEDHFGATVMTKDFIHLLKTARKREPTLFEILENISDPEDAVELAIAALRIAAGKNVIRRADIDKDE